LLEEAESYSKQPLNDDVFGEAIGGGLLNAEGEEWRWQRRLAAPLFRAEEMLRYVPAFAAASAPLLKRWNDSGAGAAQRIDRDMTGATLQALQDTVLGAGLGNDDRRAIQDAGANFLFYSMWKVALTSLRLPPSIPHPGAQKMARAGKTLRSVAQKVLAARSGANEGDDLLGRLVTARDPATGNAMPAGLIALGDVPRQLKRMREALHANLLRARRDGDLRGLSLLPLACLLAFVKRNCLSRLIGLQGDFRRSLLPLPNVLAGEFQLSPLRPDPSGCVKGHFHALGRSKLEWRFARKLSPLEGHGNLNGGISRTVIFEPVYGLHAQHQR